MPAAESPWNYAVTLIEMSRAGHGLMVGSGFFWRHEGRLYLVSAFHVLAALNDAQFHGRPAAPHVKPDTLHFHVFLKGEPAPTIHVCELPVVERGALGESPVWFQHPIHGRRIDLGAMEVPPKLCPPHALVHPANTLEAREPALPHITQEAYLLGWARSRIPPTREPPVWKRGTIAVEPNIPWTREAAEVVILDRKIPDGYSGSPCIIRGGTGEPGHVGDVTRDALLGVCISGDDDLEITKVLRRHYIEEVIAGAKPAVY